MTTAITKSAKDVRLRENAVLIDVPLVRPAGVPRAALVASARAMQRGSFGIGHSFDVVVEAADGAVLASARLSTTPSTTVETLGSAAP